MKRCGIFFLPVTFLLCCSIPFFLPHPSGNPLWPGYRVLSVSSDTANYAEQLLTPVLSSGFVSWNNQQYAVDTLQGKEFRHADTFRGGYYRDIKNWFFDDESKTQLFYIPFPDSRADQQALYRDIKNVLRPLDGSYILEFPIRSGSVLYSVFFCLFAGVCVVLIRRPCLILFALAPFLQILACRTAPVFVSAVFVFLTVVMFYCRAWNDGFSPFSRQLCKTAALSPAVIVCVVSALIAPLLCGNLFAVSGVVSLVAQCCAALMVRKWHKHKNSRRLHPRMHLTSLVPINTVYRMSAHMCMTAAAVLICGFAVNMYQRDYSSSSSMPAFVPVPAVIDNAEPLSLEQLLMVLQYEECHESVRRISSLADYMALQWFNRMRMIVPAIRIAEFERLGYSFAPVALTLNHYAAAGIQIKEQPELFSPDDVLSELIQMPLPPLEYMQSQSGCYQPVLCKVNAAAVQKLSYADNFAVMLVPVIVTAAAAVCFSVLFRRVGRQKALFRIVSNVGDRHNEKDM